MKLKHLPFIAGGALLALSSCSSDEPVMTGNGDGNVTFTVCLPGAIGTRDGETAEQAYANGKTAQELHYYIYDLDKDEFIVESSQSIDITATVNMNLVNGKEYGIIWFAKNATAPWSVDKDNKTIDFTLPDADSDGTPEAIKHNEETYDAFYAYTTVKVEGAINQPVELYRPFAQVNVGTNDIILKANAKTEEEKVNAEILENAFGTGLANLHTRMAITTTVPTTLNPIDGTVTGEQTITYVPSTIPSDVQTFPVDGYKYLAMNYILAGKGENGTGNVHNLEFTILKGENDADVYNTITVASVPVKANYRTNIYGQLLTSAANFTVTIEPEPIGDVENRNLWDGKTVSYPTLNSDDKEIVVNSAADFIAVAQMINGTVAKTVADIPRGPNGELLLSDIYDMYALTNAWAGDDPANWSYVAANDLKDYTLKLNGNVDFNGQEWSGFGDSEHPFAGKIEGNGYSISGLVNALINNANGATVENVSIDVHSNYGALIRESDGNVSISNVKVYGEVSKSLDDDDLNTKQGASAFVSYVKGGSLLIEECENHANITDDSYLAGGFVGRTACPVTIKNCKNYGNVASYRPDQGKAAGFIGVPAAKTVIENCNNYGEIYVESKLLAAAGGIVGWFGGELTITNCTNEGNINASIDGTNGTSLSPIGGIYGGSGWGTAPKLITGCKNTGNITVVVKNVNSTGYEKGVYVDSIMGATSYDDVTINDCTAGGSIKVTSEGTQMQYLAGLVGGLGWNKSITMKNNVIESSLSIEGNQDENTKINALYFNIANANPAAVPVLENNTNNTSYAEKGGL